MLSFIAGARTYKLEDRNNLFDFFMMLLEYCDKIVIPLFSSVLNPIFMIAYYKSRQGVKDSEQCSFIYLFYFFLSEAASDCSAIIVKCSR